MPRTVRVRWSRRVLGEEHTDVEVVVPDEADEDAFVDWYMRGLEHGDFVWQRDEAEYEDYAWVIQRRLASGYLPDGSWQPLPGQILARALTPQEVSEFQQYACKNDPPNPDLSLYHPVIRDVWRERGLAPTEQPVDEDRSA